MTCCVSRCAAPRPAVPRDQELLQVSSEGESLLPGCSPGATSLPFPSPYHKVEGMTSSASEFTVLGTVCTIDSPL